MQSITVCYYVLLPVALVMLVYKTVPSISLLSTFDKKKPFWGTGKGNITNTNYVHKAIPTNIKHYSVKLLLIAK